MHMEIRMRGDAATRLRQLAGKQLASARTNLVREAMVEALQATIENNPVATGRSRAAWVVALEELGGTPPAGWEGTAPRGTEEGRQLGSLSQDESADQSSVAATNAVHYVTFLEYGTSRKAPVAMARRGLLRAARRLAEWFRL